LLTSVLDVLGRQGLAARRKSADGWNGNAPFLATENSAMFDMLAVCSWRRLAGGRELALPMAADTSSRRGSQERIKVR
jgi:hypothetical protein